tara:strand:+ start:20006 stop:20392 length:387 start_codon:yes stop_codon:yes gene_type:complete
VAGARPYVSPRWVFNAISDFLGQQPGFALVFAASNENLLIVFTEGQENCPSISIDYRARVATRPGAIRNYYLLWSPGFAIVGTFSQDDIYFVIIVAVVPTGLAEGKHNTLRAYRKGRDAIKEVSGFPG